MAVRWSLLTFVILTLRFSPYHCTSDVGGDIGKTAHTKGTKDEFVEIVLRSRHARTPAIRENRYRSRGMIGDVRGFKDDIEPVGEDDSNISQALNLLHVDVVGSERTCLRVDTGDQCCRTVTFWDVFVDGRSTQDFLLMSTALASHNMSKYMWLPFNETHSTPPVRRFTCVPRNVTQQRVRIMTSAELVQILGPKNESRGYCAVVMFYAPWCVFCARVAPHYNALARAFPQLDVLAIDAMHFSNLNSRFGTVAVPSILLFHNSKAVSRFNGTLRILDSLVSFITNVTGLQPNISVGVLPDDYNGPLASTPSASPDYLLWLAWSFTITVFAIVLVRSTVVAHLVNSVLSFGQEHQAIH